ncbi:hypothetical protein VOLCADRAFT_105639 [Volvox carteri f. nagariensis]|uniref:FAD dependent oxidoreductase domain-containing protein n=1 Tax=Volvox carteri f. nagariensis TaxID=3068 RepID=D8U208_VOLCA|nr:uncharacterized protein VOLCADRAFT_105639 [Volvox carteri f. nagariensis]EFJ46200.1 hypothetical protein VOLCADRAFT_105639 [Volvox carteri f. nagariensis]|eukprot:XP_002952647.1 hypothetical protein VOLCADRAFT_105639 [Volvox carteri f. nagariensis]
MPVGGLFLRNASKQHNKLFYLSYAQKLACEAHSAGSMRRMSTGIATPQVAVIGAGISGAICSHLLSRRGAKVDVFDMGRQHPGGRASSRVPGPSGGSSAAGGGGGGVGNGGASSLAPGTDFQFDYGCQFLTATSPHMRRLVEEWLEAGVVAEWRPRLGVYDAARGVVKSGEELSAAEVLEVGSSRLPPLPPPGAPLYVGVPAMGALDVCTDMYPYPGTDDRLLVPYYRPIVAPVPAQYFADYFPVQRARWSGSSWLLGAQRFRPRGAVEAGGGGGGVCGGGGNTRTSESHGSQQNDAATVCTTPSSSPSAAPASASAGGSGGRVANVDGCWMDLGAPYDALVFTDSQVARPDAPGYVELQGGPPSLQELTTRLREQIRVPQFILMVGWNPQQQQQQPAVAATSTAGQVPQLPADALHVVGGSAVHWVAVDSSKPAPPRSRRHRSSHPTAGAAATPPHPWAQRRYGTRIAVGLHVGTSARGLDWSRLLRVALRLRRQWLRCSACRPQLSCGAAGWYVEGRSRVQELGHHSSERPGASVKGRRGLQMAPTPPMPGVILPDGLLLERCLAQLGAPGSDRPAGVRIKWLRVLEDLSVIR